MTAPTLHTIPEVCRLTRMGELSSNPEQWLTRQIVAGRFRARKIGRQWAMTDADIEFMLDQLVNTVDPAAPAVDEVAAPAGMPSVASMRLRRRPA